MLFRNQFTFGSSKNPGFSLRDITAKMATGNVHFGEWNNNTRSEKSMNIRDRECRPRGLFDVFSTDISPLLLLSPSRL